MHSSQLIALLIIAFVLLLFPVIALLCGIEAGSVLLILIIAEFILFALGILLYHGTLLRFKQLLLSIFDENACLPEPQCEKLPLIREILTISHEMRSRQSERSEYSITQVQVLMNQINPHFLYNTLESIRGQALYVNDTVVADMAEMLASFYRYCISAKGSFVSLWDELQNIHVYLKIMQFRFGERFEFRSLFEDKLELIQSEIPKLTLQPIVENAILHGLQDFNSGGVISLRIERTGELIFLYIQDNGCGIPSDKLKQINDRLNTSETDSASRHGIALYNINRRIKLSYGKKYGLNVYSTQGQGTTVAICLPFIHFEEGRHT